MIDAEHLLVGTRCWRHEVLEAEVEGRSLDQTQKERRAGGLVPSTYALELGQADVQERAIRAKFFGVGELLRNQYQEYLADFSSSVAWALSRRTDASMYPNLNLS
jgi:hypothetical protein